MSKKIQYSNEPLGDIEFIPDFLPSPEELALKEQNTKITISLSSESVTYFKEAAKKTSHAVSKDYSKTAR